MDFVSVKIPKEKGKFVRLLKAEEIKSGVYDATDAMVIGEAVEFAFNRKREFIDRNRKGNVGEVLKLAGSWNLSDAEAKKRIREIREWRTMKRTTA